MLKLKNIKHNINKGKKRAISNESIAYVLSNTFQTNTFHITYVYTPVALTVI